MGNFEGWLLKFGSVILPNSFLLADGWEETPNQRTEIEAYRDADILLHRETSKNYKSKFKITIRELNLSEMEAFHAVLNGSIVNEKERKIDITYWNSEVLDYVHSVTNFYLTDTTYKIHTIDELKKDINYNSFFMTFIEY